MNHFLLLPLVSLLVVCSIMFVIWLWAMKINNAGIVDVFWSSNFGVLAILIWLMADGDSTRKNLVCSLVLLWSLRISLFLFKRVFSHLSIEDARYQQLRKEWAKNIKLSFFVFFQAQALSNLFLAIPFFITSFNKNPRFSWLEYLGGFLWLVSIIGEGIADWQLSSFKKNPNNKGKVCEKGLWGYSRHPNYFFQLLLWISVFIFSLASPYGWISIVCPVMIGYLLFKVTGIPMNEEQSIRSKGEAYLEYQRRTSAFIPWFRKIQSEK